MNEENQPVCARFKGTYVTLYSVSLKTKVILNLLEQVFACQISLSNAFDSAPLANKYLTLKLTPAKTDGINKNRHQAYHFIGTIKSSIDETEKIENSAASSSTSISSRYFTNN